MKVQLRIQKEVLFRDLVPGTVFFNAGRIMMATDWERRAINISNGELERLAENEAVTLIEPIAVEDGTIAFAEK